MVFFKEWLRNHPKFLLHFLIHIDVVMLCSKFELIPTSIFQVITFLRNFEFLKTPYSTLYVSIICFIPLIVYHVLCSLGIVAVSVGEPYSLNERIELSFKLVHSNSLVLLWSFTDPIHPQVIYILLHTVHVHMHTLYCIIHISLYCVPKFIYILIFV